MCRKMIKTNVKNEWPFFPLFITTFDTLVEFTMFTTSEIRNY